MTKKPSSDTVEIDADHYFLLELSEYLDVLGSPVRLKILKFIEKEPKDARAIANEINTSLENTYKHLKQLSSIGAIKKEAGVGKEGPTGVHAVWKYSVVPGYYRTLLWNIGRFNNVGLIQDDKVIKDKISDVKNKISNEFYGKFPALIIIEGAEEGKDFVVKKDIVNIGRLDSEDPKAVGEEGDIVLSAVYENVTRIVKPHARLVKDGKDWYIEDCDSTNGTRLENKTLTKYKKAKLNDGNIIELAAGMKGVRMMYVAPSA